MPNVTVYIKNAIWSKIVKEHDGDDLKARQFLKRQIEELHG